MTQVAAPYISFDDFFEEEIDREEKCEWLDGVVYAMSRGTPEHGRLIAAISSALTVALRGKCSVYSSETMLYIRKTKLSTYADVSVVCGAPEYERVMKQGRSLGEAIVNPRLLVEVLSPKTESYDRAEKFMHYSRIPSLDEYVLMSSEKRKIVVMRRPTGRGRKWAVDEAGTGDIIMMLGHELRVDDLYAV